jgi:hypothetical protein
VCQLASEKIEIEVCQLAQRVVPLWPLSADARWRRSKYADKLV